LPQREQRKGSPKADAKNKKAAKVPVFDDVFFVLFAIWQ
jgi:hypothetical protein